MPCEHPQVPPDVDAVRVEHEADREGLAQLTGRGGATELPGQGLKVEHLLHAHALPVLKGVDRPGGLGAGLGGLGHGSRGSVAGRGDVLVPLLGRA